MKSLFRIIVSLGAKFIDSDGDGKIEISDLPGALARVASLRARGEAMVKAADGVIDAIVDMAGKGEVTSQGQQVSAADVVAAGERAKAATSAGPSWVKADMANG